MGELCLGGREGGEKAIMLKIKGSCAQNRMKRELCPGGKKRELCPQEGGGRDFFA